MAVDVKERIESELEVRAYIQDLKHALNSGAKIDFQIHRRVDDNRDEKFTNQYTIRTLFPNENPAEALKRELLSLRVEEYIRTELGGVFMYMKILKKEKFLCTCCMEEHEVKTVLINEQATFKDKKVHFEAAYLYCDIEEELYVNEQQLAENDAQLKDAYRKAEGLLISSEIRAIREKYGISQSDLCVLLGWGAKTITRYEKHQVQDRAHDSILKKINKDPEWFLTLLQETKTKLPYESFKKYFDVAVELYESERDCYLRKAIEANYGKYKESSLLQGNTVLSLDKVVDVIRYFSASKQVVDLYKVKLMKMMWYADALSYKRRGYAITGLVYQALKMGAVPIGHNSIIDLKGVPCEEIDMGEGNAYFFSLKEASCYPSLSEEDKKILDAVIAKFSRMTQKEIVAYMHMEQAYTDTPLKEMISYEYAESLNF